MCKPCLVTSSYPETCVRIRWCVASTCVHSTPLSLWLIVGTHRAGARRKAFRVQSFLGLDPALVKPTARLSTCTAVTLQIARRSKTQQHVVVRRSSRWFFVCRTYSLDLHSLEARRARFIGAGFPFFGCHWFSSGNKSSCHPVMMGFHEAKSHVAPQLVTPRKTPYVHYCMRSCFMRRNDLCGIAGSYIHNTWVEPVPHEHTTSSRSNKLKSYGVE